MALRRFFYSAVFVFMICAYHAPAYAQTCELPVAVGTAQADITTELTTTTGSLTGKITTATTSILARLAYFELSVVNAINGLGRAVTNGNGNLMTAMAKIEQASNDALIVHDQNKDNLEMGRKLRVSAADCVKATLTNHQTGIDAIAKAAQKVISADFAKLYSGKPSSLLPILDNDGNHSNNRLTVTANLYNYWLAYYCDPESNGGLVPEGCGEGRNDRDFLMNRPLTMAAGLLEPGTFQDDDQERQAMALVLLGLYGLPPDKISKPSLETASGQAAMVNRQSKLFKKAVLSEYASKLFAWKFPAGNDDSGRLVKDIYINALGENGKSGGDAEQIVNYIEATIPKNVSKSEFLNAQILKYTNPGTDLYEGADLDRYRVRLEQYNTYLSHLILKEMEQGNFFQSISLAQEING